MTKAQLKSGAWPPGITDGKHRGPIQTWPQKGLWTSQYKSLEEYRAAIGQSEERKKEKIDPNTDAVYHIGGILPGITDPTVRGQRATWPQKGTWVDRRTGCAYAVDVDWEAEIAKIKEHLAQTSDEMLIEDDRLTPLPAESEWLPIVHEIASGERQRDYGRPLINFLRTAMQWTINHAGDLRKGKYFDPLKIARDMVSLKQMRDINMYKDDNHIDTMGYERCVEDIDQQMKELGYEDGIQAFRTMNFQQMYDLLWELANS